MPISGKPEIDAPGPESITPVEDYRDVGGYGLVWAVYAPTDRIGRKDLVGNYGGASAGIAAGPGVGANTLWGGSNNTIALQPISVEGSLGVGVAAGIAGLELR